MINQPPDRYIYILHNNYINICLEEIHFPRESIEEITRVWEWILLMPLMNQGLERVIFVPWQRSINGAIKILLSSRLAVKRRCHPMDG